MDWSHIWGAIQTYAPVVVMTASVAANGINAVNPQVANSSAMKGVQSVINWLALNFVQKK